MSKALLEAKIQAVITTFLTSNKTGDDFEENDFVDDVFHYFKHFIYSPKHKFGLVNGPILGLPENDVHTTALFLFKDEETDTVCYSVICCEYEADFGDDKRLTNLILDRIMTEEEFKDSLAQQREQFQKKSEEEQFMTFFTM